MLQVKNLVKRYTTKGETLVALDHVSVDFPEKGMVFLLGKSGSGKSTLLNVSGGLDTPDEGEIIVKGKSSKEFSGSDFDSYRNTYVGFIFQEYNILSELTVAENVALALELQGKPRDAEEVNRLLEQVDLSGYGDRRPNTLSGGQKQRVAIARALVKNPEIIMGDEPTGALDSATGKQVFDTLKKLSEDKLVVIVSHDRDFAETYADRIIELKDGKIVSDVSRGEGGEEYSNLTELSDKKLSVTCGAALSQEEEQRILAFLRRTKTGILITSDKEDVEEAAGQSGYVGFTRTPTTEAPPAKDESKFIKSSFPMRYAFKMGFAGLRLKPLRLIFTTLLATVAFIVFGVFSTLLTYNTASLGATTLSESTYSAAVLEKFGIVHLNNGGENYTQKVSSGLHSSHFSAQEIAELKETYPKLNLIPAYTLNLSAIGFSASQFRGGENSDYYSYLKEFTAFAELSSVQPYLETNDALKLVAGTLPENTNECLISKEVFENFKFFGVVYASGETKPIETYDDLIGEQIRIRAGDAGTAGDPNIYLTIKGIVDTQEDFSAYERLKEGREGSGMDNAEWRDFRNEFVEHFKYSMAGLCIVGDGFYGEYSHFDVYVNGNKTVQSLRNQMSDLSPYFTSSNYLSRSSFQSAQFGKVDLYTVSEEAEPKGSYVQYLFSALGEERDYKCKTLMKLDSAEYPESDVSYQAPYAFMTEIRASQDTFDQIFVILGTAAIVLAVFAALLLFNFITASINAKKKDIGILRAVGARGIDVFKIFIVEGIAITLFCFALGSLGSLLACYLTNSVLLSSAIMSYKMFAFGWSNVLIVLAIAFVTAIVATAIPVALTVRKKPVEAIRSI